MTEYDIVGVSFIRVGSVISKRGNLHGNCPDSNGHSPVCYPRRDNRIIRKDTHDRIRRRIRREVIVDRIDPDK